MTDFSAVYDHKAFASRCCEQPHHSNMDVFVISYVQVEDGKRVVETEVVRVISEAKGNAQFHNTALKQVTCLAASPATPYPPSHPPAVMSRGPGVVVGQLRPAPCSPVGISAFLARSLGVG